MTSTMAWIGRAANSQMRCAGCASLSARPRVRFLDLDRGIRVAEHFDRTKIGMVHRHPNCRPTHIATCSHIGVIVGRWQMFVG